MTELEQLKAENATLRKIISECATACGAAVSPACSIDFMGQLPGEVASVCGRFKRDTEVWRRIATELRGAVDCHELHHSKPEQHARGESCTVLGRIDAALSQGEWV